MKLWNQRMTRTAIDAWQRSGFVRDFDRLLRTAEQRFTQYGWLPAFNDTKAEPQGVPSERSFAMR